MKRRSFLAIVGAALASPFSLVRNPAQASTSAQAYRGTAYLIMNRQTVEPLPIESAIEPTRWVSGRPVGGPYVHRFDGRQYYVAPDGRVIWLDAANTQRLRARS